MYGSVYGSPWQHLKETCIFVCVSHMIGAMFVAKCNKKGRVNIKKGETKKSKSDDEEDAEGRKCKKIIKTKTRQTGIWNGRRKRAKLLGFFRGNFLFFFHVIYEHNN